MISSALNISSQECRTYCSGLWLISGNKKRSPHHYRALLPSTIKMLRGNRLIFFSDSSETLAFLNDLCIYYDVAFQPILKEIEDLPAWRLSGEFVLSCQRMSLDRFARPPHIDFAEKGVIHYWRDFHDSGHRIYRCMLAIWLSKILLVEQEVQRSGHEGIFAWIDSGLYRIKGSRNNWNWTKTQTIYNKLSHYGSPMKFYGSKLPLSAGFLCAYNDTWHEVAREFRQSANEAANIPYGHDDETILSDCVYRRPELFNCVGGIRSPHFLNFKFKDILRGILKTYNSLLNK